MAIAIIDRCPVAPVKTAENDPMFEDLRLDSASRFAYRLEYAFAVKLEYIREKADRSRPAKQASHPVPIQASRAPERRKGHAVNERDRHKQL